MTEILSINDPATAKTNSSDDIVESPSRTPAAATPNDAEQRLAELEANVRDNLVAVQRNVVQIGAWLTEISDGKLYRAKDFDTFDEYCLKTFGFTRQHGYRYINAAAVVNRVNDLNPAIDITNEAQARELTGLLHKPEKFKAAVKLLAKTDEPLTSARVRDVVRGVLRSPTDTAAPESARQKKLRAQLPAGVELRRWEKGTVATVRLDMAKYVVNPAPKA